MHGHRESICTSLSLLIVLSPGAAKPHICTVCRGHALCTGTRARAHACRAHIVPKTDACAACGSHAFGSLPTPAHPSAPKSQILDLPCMGPDLSSTACTLPVSSPVQGGDAVLVDAQPGAHSASCGCRDITASRLLAQEKSHEAAPPDRPEGCGGPRSWLAAGRCVP